MGLTDTYLITTKNLESFFNAIQAAKAPEKFTIKFLRDLEFKSSNDLLFIKLLKELNFLDNSGIPTQRYFEFLDQSQTKKILAKSIQEAYADIFSTNKEANKLSKDEIKNKLKTLTQGKKSEKVISLMANTFVSLCEYADWEAPLKTNGLDKIGTEKEQEKKTTEEDLIHLKTQKFGLHYNIQIHLPESRDAAVYDAIFGSLKKHIL